MLLTDLPRSGSQGQAPAGADAVANDVAVPEPAPVPAATSSWSPFRLVQMAVGAAVAALGIASVVFTAAPGGTAASRVSSVPPRMEASSDDFELVAAAEGRQLVLYLTEYIGNGPVAGAKLTVSLDDREAVVVERGGGVYAVADAGLAGPGQAAVTVSIDAGGRQDLLGGVLDLPGDVAVQQTAAPWLPSVSSGAWLMGFGAFLLGLGVAQGRSGRATTLALLLLAVGGLPAAAHPGHGDDSAAVSNEDLDSSTLPPGSPRRLSDGSLFVPKQAQLILGIRTALSQQGEATRAIRLVGRVVGDPAASGTVQSTMIGRVELVPGGMPRVGQRVKRGEVLAAIAPVINAIDRGNIQQQLSLIDRDLGTLQRRAEDAVGGNGNGNGNGHGDAKEADTITAEIETLLKRRTSITRIIVDREGMQIPLRSPADGVIAVANVVAGQIVDARTTLYEIVDPDRIWVEASGYDPTMLGAVAGGHAVTADGRALPLDYIGHGPKLTQQAIPLLFHVREPTMLPIGTPVTVLVETRHKQAGIILPPAAVVRNPAGQMIVWQHTAAERFAPLLVRTAPVDGRSVAVVSGLADNRRVVVVGADLLNQVR